MDNPFLTDDLSQLDQQSLEKIAQIAEQARQSLLLGIATLRHLEPPPQPESDTTHSLLMVEQLSRLTLMWDEIHHRAHQLLTQEPLPGDDWPTARKSAPKILH